MTVPPQPAADPTTRFHQTLELSEPYVAGVFDLSERGGPEYTIVVKARSAAHVRKLATRIGDCLAADAEGDAPDGSEPWLVVDGGEVVAHLLTESSLGRYGLVELFAGEPHPADVFVVVAEQRLKELRERRVG